MFLKCWKSNLEAWTPLILMIFPKNIISLLRFPLLHCDYFPNPKNASRVRRGDCDPPPCRFSKKVFSREGETLFFLWLLILSWALHFLKFSVKFPKSFLWYEDFPLQSKLFSLFFSDFLSFACCKETNKVSIKELM